MSTVHHLYSVPGDKPLVMEYALKAADLARNHDLHTLLPNTLVNLTHFLNELEDYERSVQYGEELISFLEQSNKKPHFSEDFFLSRAYVNAHANLAWALSGAGEPGKAERYFQKGLEASKRYGPFPQAEIAHWEGLGRMYLKSDSPDKAIECLESAIEISKTLDNMEETARSCYELLSEAFVKKDDYKQALIFNQRYHEANQSLSSGSVTLSYEVLEAKQRLTKSITDIEQLKEHNQREQQLNQALAEMNADLTTYTNIIGHDLRSPLQAILSNAELLKSGTCSVAQVQQHSSFISNSVMTMSRQLDDLMLYSKLSLGDQPTFEVVDLDKIAQETIRSLEAEFGTEFGTKVELSAAKLPTVLGSETLLAALFKNLLSNALKYQPKELPTHTPSVAITTSSTEKHEHSILFADNGIGVKEEFLENLFEPFQRGSKNEYEGTGLGLSICKQIMQIHNGSITLKNSTEKGSCFQLSFDASLTASSR